MKPITIFLGVFLASCIGGPLQDAAFGAPPPSFSIDNATTSEELKQICFAVRKHGTPSSSPSSVTFQTQAGTAKAGTDYVSQSFGITMGPNESRRDACVPLVNDNIPEPTETFTGKLTKGSNSRLYDGTAIGTIEDSDSPPVTLPVVNVENVAVNEDAGSVIVHVRRSSGEGSTSFDWKTVNGTAISGVNYTGSNGSAGFGPGGTDAAFTIPILRDGKVTGDLVFSFVLGVVTNGTKGTDGTVSIRNVDTPAPPRVVTCQDISVREDAGSAMVNCTVTTNGQSAVVDVLVQGGGMPTATAGEDYTPFKARYSIPVDATGFSFPITIINDTLVEGVETFGAAIVGVTNATSGHNPAISIADDDVAPVPPAEGLLRIKSCPANPPSPYGDTPAPLWGHNPDGALEIAKVGQLVKKIENSTGVVYRPGDFVNLSSAIAVQAVDASGGPLNGPGGFYVFKDCLEPAG